MAACQSSTQQAHQPSRQQWRMQPLPPHAHLIPVPGQGWEHTRSGRVHHEPSECDESPHEALARYSCTGQRVPCRFVSDMVNQCVELLLIHMLHQVVLPYCDSPVKAFPPRLHSSSRVYFGPALTAVSLARGNRGSAMAAGLDGHSLAALAAVLHVRCNGCTTMRTPRCHICPRSFDAVDHRDECECGPGADHDSRDHPVERTLSRRPQHQAQPFQRGAARNNVPKRQALWCANEISHEPTHQAADGREAERAHWGRVLGRLF